MRIDPIVPISGYMAKYRRLVDEVFKKEIQPETITLGPLRGLVSTLAHTRNGSWKHFLDEKVRSSWGYKPTFDLRIGMYHNIMDHLESYGFNGVGVCKETLGLWRKLGLSFESTRCNCSL